jgi:hypothetical protein
MLKKIWTVVLFFLAFLSFGAALYFFVKSKMIKNTEKIIFLTSSETQAILDNDADHYYQTFNKTDLKLRKSKTLTEYLDKISNSGVEGSEENKEKIIDCIERINQKLPSGIQEGVDIRKFVEMDWRIGFTGDMLYENGLPHTRTNVIILNNTDIEKKSIPSLCRLLIHEKAHVYQKTYKTEFSKYLDENFEVAEKKGKQEDIPANPDTDKFIYKRKSTGEILQGRYHEKPKHFRDIAFTDDDHTKEHPYESVAYTLEKLYSD